MYLFFSHTRTRSQIPKLIIGGLFVALAMVSIHPGKVAALSGSGFQPGHIIDNDIFTNDNAMSVQDIQNFLNAKVGSCNAPGTKSSNPPNGACINQYVENTSTLQNNFSNPGASIPGGISAAQIIWNAAQAYQINPEVILTTLQKERGLVTDNWPWYVEYQHAMGYSCPDSGSCSSSYADFYKQVDGAAWQFRYYLTHPGAYNYWTGNNYIQYNPNASCGGSVVDIQNSATAALYIYTPYQPDSSALGYIGGTNSNHYDVCSSLGNLNFWYYFNTWFGPSLDQNNFCPEITNGGQAGLNGCPDILPGSFSGDGKTDLAQIWSGGVNTWLSNGDGTYTVTQPYKPFSGYNMTTALQWVSGDFNGDGKTDLAEITDNGVVVWLSNGNGTYTVEPTYVPSAGYNMTNGEFLAGDFNGDGKTDLVHVWSDGVDTWLSNGDGTFNVSNTYLPFSNYNMNGGFYWMVADVTGNGKDDLLHLWSGGVNTWLSNGDGTYTVTQPYKPFSGYNMNGGTWQFGDVNGDGKIDLIHVWSGGVNTWLSNGDGTYTVTQPYKPFSNYSMTAGYEFLAGDYDGSGKVGLAHIWSGGVNTWLSNGDGTYTVTAPYLPFPSYYTGGGTWY